MDMAHRYFALTRILSVQSIQLSTSDMAHLHKSALPLALGADQDISNQPNLDIMCNYTACQFYAIETS